MRYVAITFYIISLVATGLPLINSNQWWIRIFDFPRAQIAFLCLVSLVLFYFYVKLRWKYKVPLGLVLIGALCFQLHHIVIYTPLYPVRAKESNQATEENSFSLLVSNVRMKNEEKHRFINLVRRHKPEILLINEPDDRWAEAIKELEDEYPHTIKHPLSNTYGMMLLSKLPFSEGKVNFLVEDDIPSIHAVIKLPGGGKFDFYGVHPEPPKPGTDTYERDTELLIIGKKIKNENSPAIVAGDLNDVGWSGTSKLFRKYSELLDPREGRGLYNTYSVFIPLLRYPLDHIFYSKEFGLTKLEKLESIGSDHFPILIHLTYEPGEDKSNTKEKPDAKESEEVEEEIREKEK
jgi:endonuclease/exonuclease/phosphatase (EEP) superfamily protein YafD